MTARSPYRVIALASLLALLCRSSFGDESQLQAGKTIFVNRCAKCHGADGRGVADRDVEPLGGAATVDKLTELIQDTMPDDDPDACTGEDAAAVAAYIHSSFYSQSPARPRIQLARLTAAQLRQSLAELNSHFAGTAKLSDNRGLRGEYYDGARPRRDKRRIERIDATVNFDFADKGPGEKINAQDFSIQWNGGLKVDVTGEYEIVLRSTCAFVCYLGSYDRQLIDNHVQSGDKTEFRRSLVLTAGRAYPLRIQFYQRKRKTKQPPARISLSWVPPYATEQIIPARNLVSDNVPAAFALQAKLPPDDRSYGYERGIAVDRQWDDSTTAAAIEFAQFAANELWPRYKRDSRGVADENRARLRRFLSEIVEAAFRGPIDDSIRAVYVDAHVDAFEDDGEAIRRSILITLKSPRFLYPLLDHGRSASQRAANRLALTLHDSLPADRWLVDAARNNSLQSEDQIRSAARRMVADYRTRGKTREMLYAWLDMNHVDEISKDAEAFPGFDAQLVGDLRVSLDAFLDDVVWSEDSDFRQLLQADWTYTNGRLHDYYGAAWKPVSDGAGLQKSVSASDRSGLLAHPYLMSRLAYTDSTSPIHRGVFLIRNMFGRTLNPPQEAFTPLSPDLHPDLSTRERIALQTSPKNCQVCHVKINALGFTLENFDAVGRYRVKEKGRELDTTGSYTTRNGREAKVVGPRELSELLATSDDAHRAFVDRAFEHFVKQPVAAYGTDQLDRLTESFRKNNFSIRELLVEIAIVAAKQPDE